MTAAHETTTGRTVLARAIRRNRGWLVSGSVLYGAHQVCEALVPVVIGVVVDTAIGTGDGRALVTWLIALAGLFLILTLMWRFGARVTTYAEAGEGAALRTEVGATTLRPNGIRTTLRSGELLSIAGSDADNSAYLLDYIPRFVAAVAATTVCAVALLSIDVALGAVVVVGTLALVLALHRAGPLIAARVHDQQQTAGRATATATDLLNGLRPLRGIGAQRVAAERYRQVSRESLRAAVRAARTQSLFGGISATVSYLFATAIAVGAALFALDGRIGIGEFVTVVGLAQFLVEPLTELTVMPSWFAEARASARRVASVLDAPPELESHTAAMAHPPYALNIAGLCYGTLTGLDLTIEPGAMVGIVAPDDADALAAVLSRRVPADELTGTVTVGGAPIGSAARRLVLAEPHVSDLFSGSMIENITAGTALDPDRFRAALTAACASEIVTTTVAERGANLSGGQRQRVALARALYATPAVLILHDPTTAIDSVTEHAVAQGIRSMRHSGGGDFGTVILTTSPPLLAATDTVVLIRDGRVAARGTHAVLAETDAGYREAVLR